MAAGLESLCADSTKVKRGKGATVLYSPWTAPICRGFKAVLLLTLSYPFVILPGGKFLLGFNACLQHPAPGAVLPAEVGAEMNTVLVVW